MAPSSWRPCLFCLELLALVVLASLVEGRLMFGSEPASDGLSTTSNGEPWERYHSFLSSYGKSYEEEEHWRRFHIFQENLRVIDEANRAGLNYTLAVNEFADRTWDEFKSASLGSWQNCSATKGNHQWVNGVLPMLKDWREDGIISPVKNQGHCGSCWTFSTTGCLEAAHAQVTGNMVLLSEQQLVDCASAFNNHGCEGGLPSQAFEYVRLTGGLDTEESYPYKAHDEKCVKNPNTVGATVLDVRNITAYDEDELLNAVAFTQPVSVAFEVVPDFRFYKEGVYSSDKCRAAPDTVNHAVLAVGYGETEEGTPYWIIKNSWSEKWGMGGYFFMQRGKNMCGVATCASYPIVPGGNKQSGQAATKDKEYSVQ